MSKRTSGWQQGRPRRLSTRAKRKQADNPGRRTFLKAALGWTADHAAGGLVQAAVLSGGAALLRRVTTPHATVLTPGTGSLVLLGGSARLELHASGTLV
jgi:hypothetical protein